MRRQRRIREQVAQVLADFGTGSGHVFNLGHGIHPAVDPAHVEVLVNAVHELSPRLSCAGQREPRRRLMPSPHRHRFSASGKRDKQRRLAGMKRLATGMLLLMAVIFVASRIYQPQWPWLAWVEAFAEAAMVGALADWFAVTALFRHPLGLPIPHTAIIPRRKNELGDNLARFVRENFLIRDALQPRLYALDAAGRAGAWLEHARTTPAA